MASTRPFQCSVITRMSQLMGLEDLLNLGQKRSCDLSSISLQKLRLTCSFRREHIEETVASWNDLLFRHKVPQGKRAHSLLSRPEHSCGWNIGQGLNSCLNTQERGQREPYVSITSASQLFAHFDRLIAVRLHLRHGKGVWNLQPLRDCNSYHAGKSIAGLSARQNKVVFELFQSRGQNGTRSLGILKLHIDAHRPVRALGERQIEDILRRYGPHGQNRHLSPVGPLQGNGFLQRILVAFVHDLELALVVEGFAAGSDFNVGDCPRRCLTTYGYLHYLTPLELLANSVPPCSAPCHRASHEPRSAGIIVIEKSAGKLSGCIEA